MKKFLAVAALLAASCFGISAPVHAQLNYGPHIAVIPLHFRTNANGVVLDSMTFNRQIGGSLDTTAAISLAGLALPPTGSTVVDSMWTGRVMLGDAGNTGTVDTIGVTIQVSPDGVNFINSDLTPPLSMARATTTNSKVFSRSLKGSNVSPIAVDSENLRGWPYIRFIFTTDATSNSVWQNFAGWFAYPTANAYAGSGP